MSRVRRLRPAWPTAASFSSSWASRRPQVSPDSWTYFPNPDLLFGRSHEPKNWSAAMVPGASVTSLALEVFSSPGEPAWDSRDDRPGQACRGRFAGVGWIRRSDVTHAWVLRVPDAYPVHDLGYAERLAKVRRVLDRYPRASAARAHRRVLLHERRWCRRGLLQARRRTRPRQDAAVRPLDTDTGPLGLAGIAARGVRLERRAWPSQQFLRGPEEEPAARAREVQPVPRQGRQREERPAHTPQRTRRTRRSAPRGPGPRTGPRRTPHGNQGDASSAAASTNTSATLARELVLTFRSFGSTRERMISRVHGTARANTSVRSIDSAVQRFRCVTCRSLRRRIRWPARRSR